MKKIQSGQTLLIVLLIMAVALTVGLAIVSRSITDIRISRQEEESARAFSVAEAGIEESLKAGLATSVKIGGIEAVVSEIAQGDSPEYNFGGREFEEGDTQTVWLRERTETGFGGYSFPATGVIKLCWGKDTGNRIAVEANIIYQDNTDAGKYKVVRGAYDADHFRGNNFDNADDIDGGNCGDLAFGEDLDLDVDFDIPDNPGDAVLYVLRLRLFYNNETEPLAVFGDTDKFPLQGSCYQSTATIPESGITRKIQQCQYYSSPPGIFDYALFSELDLVKE